MDSTDIILKEYMRDVSYDFNIGDTVEVSSKITEGDKERIQLFRGVVIQKRGDKYNKTVTVRKITEGVGVEKIFPLHSPNVVNIKVIRRGKVRRAKLFYLRNLRGKASRIKEK